MDLGISGRIALVTGGDSGIGWNTAQVLLDEGATVVLSDLDQDSLDEAAARLQAPRTRVHAIAADVDSVESIFRLRDAVTEAVGDIDILVQSAGVTGAQGLFSARLGDVLPARPAARRPGASRDDRPARSRPQCRAMVVPSMVAVGEDVLAVLNELGIDTATVLGISTGGYVALELARTSPDRLDALVLGSTTTRRIEPDVPAERLVTARNIDRQRSTEPAASSADEGLGATAHRAQPELVEDLRRTIAAADPAGVAWMARADRHPLGHVAGAGRLHRTGQPGVRGRGRRHFTPARARHAPAAWFRAHHHTDRAARHRAPHAAGVAQAVADLALAVTGRLT